MLKNPIVRSLLQIMGLSAIALFMMTASPKAASSSTAMDECDDEYQACIELCGTYEYYWDGVTYDEVWDQCWDGTQYYPCNERPVPRYTWGWHADIEYFECIEGWKHGDCECHI